jgi:hypothetical protein
MRQELASEMARTDDFLLERFERKFSIKGISGN